uniref:Abnormal cell migration protein 18-like fibronectin type I domain-containing protein n=2 Tax=Onchocerca TaxID=6281 RepID=A0A8R1Y5K5_ONCVO
MFRYLFWIISLFIITANGNLSDSEKRRCWSSGNGKSARWFNHDDRINRGKYWYICNDGALQPKGCFTPNRDELYIGDKFVENGYEIECILDKNGYLQFEFSACVPKENERYKINETWEDDQHMYWFECKPDGPYLRVEIGGCVTHNKSRRIKIDEMYDYGEYTYQCQKKYNGTVQMCSVGCVHNGSHYKIGDEWTVGDFIYYCKIENGRCQKICVGCNFKNTSLYDGDRYYKDDTVFMCEVRPDKFSHKPVACIVRDKSGKIVERIVGCRWYQETNQSKVEQECVLENDKAIVKTLGCIFVYKGYDTLFLNPNTYTIWHQQVDGKAIGVLCRQSKNDSIPILETFNVEEITQKISGLRYDQPRG